MNTLLPIDYDELRHTGYTETCDLYGEVIELRFETVNTYSGRMFRITAKRGSWYGMYESHTGDDTFIRMASQFAINAMKPRFYVHNDND